MIERHVMDFLDLKGESAGLGFYSEQAMEAVHHDFKVTVLLSYYCYFLFLIFYFDFKMFWEKVKVDPDHPEFGEHLKTAVSAYNAKHL